MNAHPHSAPLAPEAEAPARPDLSRFAQNLIQAATILVPLFEAGTSIDAAALRAAAHACRAHAHARRALALRAAEESGRAFLEFGPAILDRLLPIAEAHKTLPRPESAGRHVGQRKG